MQTYNVSRETFAKLETYVALLNEWQQKFNLVSQSSLSEVWTRHIADSAQLFQYLNPEAKKVYDLGSGAGFPALVLAIIAQETYPQMKFTLIESIGKKTLYLNEVKTVLKLNNVKIINARAESLDLPPADVITARAVTALTNLLKFAYKLTDRHTDLILPKGQSFQQEIDEAQKKWNFYVKVEKNPVSEDGVILCLKNLRRKRS